ncbi:MAG TPA: hypothetical protein VEH29_12445 [Acidimicrobiales bacterium]|nr:hypothetical protein [Acidimicrobiales bacterium]
MLEAFVSSVDTSRLFFWFGGVWGKVGSHAHMARAPENEPSLHENFQAWCWAQRAGALARVIGCGAAAAVWLSQ